MWAVLGQFDEYPGAVPYQIADEMRMGDAKLQMAGFQTSDPPEKVLEFYRQEFKREKLFVPPAPLHIPLQGVTAFEPAGKIEKTVLVLPGSGGPTRVVLSISPGEGLNEQSITGEGHVPAELPVYPKSDGVFRTDADDGPRASSTVTYAAHGNAAEVLDFIQKSLAEKGWTQLRQDPAEVGEGLRYVRGAEGVQISLLPMGGSTQVTFIYVH
ncbi:MAG: hypothetical protein ACYCWW_01380 [Deltaproteobacteria bacterium]